MSWVTPPSFDFELKRRSLRLRTFEAPMDFNATNSAGAAQTFLTPNINLTSGIGANKQCIVNERPNGFLHGGPGGPNWWSHGLRLRCYMSISAAGNPTTTSRAGIEIGDLFAPQPWLPATPPLEQTIIFYASLTPGFEQWVCEAWDGVNHSSFGLLGLAPAIALFTPYLLTIEYFPGRVTLGVNNYVESFSLTMGAGGTMIRGGGLFVTSGTDPNGRTDADYDTFSFEEFGRV